MSSFFKYSLWLTFAVALTSCSSVDQSASTLEVLKSPNDDREYRYLQLDNKMDVIVISDPSAEKSAASLSVGVGSYHNPPDREGLAHFLEHMLFLGTEKYPEAGEYNKFIKQHGGGNNAYTSSEETNYMFDIKTDQFEPALDQFAQFFVSPLFTAEYVERERNAVESEYRLKINDDNRRFRDVLSELVNPAHPLSQLSVGTLDTLDNRESATIRDDMLAFYNKYYSANIMKLVVLDSQPLDDIERMVRDKFSKVKNRNVVVPKADMPLFDEGKVPAQLNVVPMAEMRRLQFMFPVDGYAAKWRTKPNYISALIGDEVSGTLIEVLKQAGLAESLSSGLYVNDLYNGLFNISIELTEAGVAQQAQVTSAVFAWLNLVREQGVEEWRYEEERKLGDIAFTFQRKGDAYDWVSRLSSNMQEYPVEFVIKAGYMHEGFEPEATKALLAKLTPDNAIKVLARADVETDKESHYYQTPYKFTPVTNTETQQWLKPTGIEAELRLPKANPYIPDNTQLLALTESERPQQYYAGEGEEVWYLPTTQFGAPEAIVRLNLYAKADKTVREAAINRLYAAYVSEMLNTELYPAIVAGLSSSVSAHSSGATIELGGYSDKQSQLLDTVLSQFMAPQWQQRTFDLVKQSAIKQLQNFKKEWPIRQVFTAGRANLYQTWRPDQLADALVGIQLADLQTFNQSFYKNLRYQMFVIGNVDSNGVKGLKQVVQNRLPTISAIPRVIDIARFPKAEQQFVLEVDHNDATAMYYLQAEKDDIKSAAAVAVLRQMLSAPFYKSLRTDQQFGYIVGAQTLSGHKDSGMTFYVQSPHAPVDAIKTAIKGFLVDYQTQLEELGSAELDNFKQAVITSIEEKPKNISELANKYVSQLREGYVQFDYDRQLVDQINSLAVADIQAFYRALIIDNPRAVWTVSEKPGGASLPSAQLRIEGMFEYHY